MAFGAMPTDSNGIPIGCVYVPGTGFIALQGSTGTSTDGSSNTSTSAVLALGASTTVSGTLQSAQAANANGTVLTVTGMASLIFTVNMSGYTGTVNFEGSEDGTNYDALQVVQSGTSTLSTTAVGSTTTSIHLYGTGCGGLTSVRARTSGAAAGTVTVTAHAVPVSALQPFSSGGGGGSGTSSSYGAAFPATGTAAGFTDGTNMQAGRAYDADTGAGTEYVQGVLLRQSASGGSVEVGTSSHPVRTDPTGTTTQPVSGTVSITSNSAVNVAQVAGTTTDTNSGVKSAGTQRVVIATDQPQLTNALKVDGSAVTQPVSGTVTANVGTTNGLALDTSVNGLLVSQGSTTSGEKGTLIQGAVTTAAPAYTTAQTSPISLTTTGAVRVDSSAVTQPVSGTVTSNQGTANATPWNENIAQIGGSSVVTAATGIIKVGVTDASGNALNSTSNALNVTQQASGSASATLQSAQTANANGTSLTVLGMAAVTFTVTVSGFTGTVNFEGTEDNSNWSSLLCTLAGGTTTATQTSAAGQYSASCAGLQSVRARTSGVSAGNVTVTAHAVPVSGGGGGGGSGSNASVSATASAVPSSATYFGGNKAGNLTGVSLDGSGNLNVNVAAGGGSGGTSSSFGVAFPATGTAIGATDGTNMKALSVDASGFLKVNVSAGGGSGGTSSSYGAAFPATGTAAGFTDGTNMQAGRAYDADTGAGTEYAQGVLLRQSASGGSVEVGTATHPVRTDPTGTTTQPVSGTVTANVGTTNGLALDTSVNGLLVSQGSTTSGEKGTLIQGAVTTAAPAYTTAQTSPLSLTTAGAVRVDNSAVTQPVSGTVTANQGTANATPWNENIAQIGGSSVVTAATGIQKVGIVGNAGASVDSTVGAGAAPTNAVVTGAIYTTSAPAPTTGQAMALQADQAGNLRVFPGIALASLSAWNNATALNATQNIFTNSGATSVLVQLTQTSTLTAGAITYEVSYDGSNWLTIPASASLDPTSSTFAQISLPYTVQASTNKQFLLNMNGAQGLRIKLSTQITGTGTVTPNYALLSDSPADTVIALSPTAANFNVTANAGTNLNTSLLALESGGNLATLAGAVSSAKVQANVSQINGVTPLMGNGVTGTGSQRVTIASDNTAFTVNAAQSGTWTVQPGNTANTTAWLVQDVAATSGGSTPSHTMSAASTNATSLKASAGMVYGFSISNANAAARYFKLYDKAGAPTVGTDTPKMTVQIPASATVIRAFPVGLVFSSGIAWAATTGIADSDTGAVGSNDLSIDIDYK